MSRRVAVLGLLSMSVMIAVTIVFLSGVLSEHPGDVAPGGAGGGSSSGATLDAPCGSCDARHQRLGKDQSGKD